MDIYVKIKVQDVIEGCGLHEISLKRGKESEYNDKAKTQ